MSYNDKYDDYLELNNTDKKIQMLKSMIEGKLHDSPSSVGNEHLKDGSVDYFKLGHGSIDSVHIRDASINSAHIQNAVIGTVHIGDATITNAKIDRATVNRIKIETADILDAAITSAKIKNAEISNAHLQDAIINSAKIANAAIQSAHIDVGVVGTTQIADGSITDAKIVDLTANKIVAGTLDAGKVSVVNLRADNIVTGSLTIVPNNEFKDSLFNVLPSGITSNAAMSYSLDSTTKYKGNNSLKTVASGSDAFLYFGQIFNVIPSEKFIVSTYAKGDATRPAQIFVQFRDSAGTVLSHHAYNFSATTNWERYYQVFTAPTGAASFKVRFDNDGGANSIIWFDAIQVQRGNIITEYAERNDETISDSAIKEPMLSNGSVSTRLIQADAITGDKIVADAITARHVAANSITANEIDVSTITIGTANISDAAVTNAKIGSLDAGKITTGTLDADKVTINANLSNVGSYIRLTGTGIVAHNGTKETFKIDDYGNATFSGKLVGGSIESGSTINITTDAHVGKNLYIGNGSTTSTWKLIKFDGSTTIGGLDYGAGGLPELSLSAHQVTWKSLSYMYSDTAIRWYGNPLTFEGDNLHILAGTGLRSSYKGKTGYGMVHCHNNGNVTLNALGGKLYLGYSDTQEVYEVAKLRRYSSDTGWCGVGGMDNNTLGACAGVGVAYQVKRTYVPSSVSFTAVSNNATPLAIDIRTDGFWLYIEGAGGSSYRYWRGTYSA